jgi:N-acetylglucosamine-6-phosphate deacetylase
VKGAIPFIKRAAALGIIIGIGHTHATEEVLEEAVEAGARLSCHLGNAPSAFLSGYQNLIEKQLAMDPLMVSIIADGVHLPQDVVKTYVRTKGINRIILTTDSMAGAKASPGRYTLGDIDVEVGPDRTARLASNSRLAGSTLTMDWAVTNAIRFAEIDLTSAIHMVTRNAKKLFSEVRGEILPGCSANLVLFEYQGELVVRSTWIDGERIF